MSKIIAINAGSSSLKFQLFEMPAEEVITKGIIERIGLQDGIFSITVNGEKIKEVTDIPDHSVAVNLLLDKLTRFRNNSNRYQKLKELDTELFMAVKTLMTQF